MAQAPYATYDEVIVSTRAAARSDEDAVKDVLMDASDLVGSIARIDFSYDELTAAIDADDVTVPVTELSFFPKSGMLIIGEERMTYSGKSAENMAGDLLNVVRAQFNTEAAAHDEGTPIVYMPTEYAERRRRCERRAFGYLWTTDGGIKKQESLTGVGARQFRHTSDLKRLIRNIMGSFVKKSHRIT